MADLEARSIIDTAMALSRTQPTAPALDILDLAMQGRHESDLDLDAQGEPFGDWTDPSSPFGDLLRRAFTPDLIGAQGTPDEWHLLVLSSHAERYRLWNIEP